MNGISNFISVLLCVKNVGGCIDKHSHILGSYTAVYRGLGNYPDDCLVVL